MNLMCVQPRQRASRDVPHYVAARTFGAETDRRECIYDLYERLDRQPVQLNILACRDVRLIARVFLG